MGFPFGEGTACFVHPEGLPRTTLQNSTESAQPGDGFNSTKLMDKKRRGSSTNRPGQRTVVQVLEQKILLDSQVLTRPSGVSCSSTGRLLKVPSNLRTFGSSLDSTQPGETPSPSLVSFSLYCGSVVRIFFPTPPLSPVCLGPFFLSKLEDSV